MVHDRGRPLGRDDDSKLNSRTQSEKRHRDMLRILVKDRKREQEKEVPSPPDNQEPLATLPELPENLKMIPMYKPGGWSRRDKSLPPNFRISEHEPQSREVQGSDLHPHIEQQPERPKNIAQMKEEISYLTTRRIDAFEREAKTSPKYKELLLQFTTSVAHQENERDKVNTQLGGVN